MAQSSLNDTAQPVDSEEEGRSSTMDRQWLKKKVKTRNYVRSSHSLWDPGLTVALTWDLSMLSQALWLLGFSSCQLYGTGS